MQKSTSGAHLVCAGAETKASHVPGAVLGVQRQVVTCFWRLTPLCNLFLAFNSRMQHGTGVECQFASSKLGKIMDYYKFLESPGCLLSNAIESAPFGVL